MVVYSIIKYQKLLIIPLLTPAISTQGHTLHFISCWRSVLPTIRWYTIYCISMTVAQSHKCTDIYQNNAFSLLQTLLTHIQFVIILHALLTSNQFILQNINILISMAIIYTDSNDFALPDSWYIKSTGYQNDSIYHRPFETDLGENQQ